MSKEASYIAISHKLDEKPVLLHIMHSWGGGVERWLQDFCHTDTRHTNIVLKSLGIPGISGQKLALFDNIDADSPAYVWDLASPIHATSITHQEYLQILDKIIKDFRVNTILVSSLIGHSLDILNTNLQTIVICHDYYPFCPAINIYFNGICSDCGIDRLERCFEENTHNSFFPLASSSEWMQVRKSYVELVCRHNIKLIVATDSVRRHLTCLEKAFKDVEFRLIPHGISTMECPEGAAIGTTQHSKLRILILGNLGFHKGIELLKDIHKDLFDIAEIYLLGCGEEGRIFEGIPGMHIIAENYSISDLPGFIGRISPDMGLLLSIAPETFSYTLSELMALRVPTLAMRVGGFPDRINDGVNGFLVDPERDAVIGKIRELAEQQHLLSAVVSNLENTKHRTVGDMVSDYYEVIDRDNTQEDDKRPVKLAALNHPEAEPFNFHMQIYLQKTYSQFNKLHGRLYQAQVKLEHAKAELKHVMASKEAVTREKEAQLTAKELELLHMHNLITAKELELLHIHNLRGWKLLLKYYNLRDTLLPPESKRRTVYTLTFNSLRLLKNGNIRKFFFYMKTVGLEAALTKTKQKVHQNSSGSAGNGFAEDYARWIAGNEPSPVELKRQRKIRFALGPKISIVVPTFNTPQHYLEEMIESVLEQTYTHWELCIADGGSQGPQRSILNKYAKADARIRVSLLDMNKGIAGNSNEALSIASGEFIVLLDHDDTLAPFALYEIVKAINENPDADFLYSDEDKINEDGCIRMHPHFKPDWSPDTLRSYNYITHLSVIKRELLETAGYFREGYEGSQDYDLILRATERARKIVHIKSVLYHWRMHESSVAANPLSKMYAHAAGKRVLNDHLQRQGISGSVSDGMEVFTYKVTYLLEKKHLVSIIIPNRDGAEMLERCIQSIVEGTTYKNIEIIVVENGSVEENTFRLYEELALRYGEIIRRIDWAEPFNYAAINNFAVRHARGDVLLFLNNDIEVINGDWLERMLEHAVRRDIGAVGAKLYYPDGHIQHAGVILGIGGVAGHSHKNFERSSYGYFSRLIVIQNLSAITGACLMMRKDVFSEVGGFDEKYSYAFNDVDLCMRIRERGYLLIFTPYAELYHYESKTRGYEDTPEKKIRFKREVDLFLIKWGATLEAGDPYYNPHLTLKKEDFSIRID